MSPTTRDTSLEDLEALLALMRTGDPNARRLLLIRCCDLISSHADLKLRRHFPYLLQRGHDPHSVVSECFPWLAKQLDDDPPQDLPRLLAMLASKVTWILRNLVEKQRRRDRREGSPEWGDSSSAPSGSRPVDRGDGPATEVCDREFWLRLHQRLSELPEDNRLVFELHYLFDIPQVEIAKLMQVPPIKVSRLWRKGCAALTGQGGDHQRH